MAQTLANSPPPLSESWEGTSIKVQNTETQRVQARYDAELPPFHFHCPAPRSSRQRGMEELTLSWASPQFDAENSRRLRLFPGVCSVGNKCFTTTGADASGRNTAKNQYWQCFFPRNYQRLPEIIASTGAKFWRNVCPSLQYCTGNFLWLRLGGPRGKFREHCRKTVCPENTKEIISFFNFLRCKKLCLRRQKSIPPEAQTRQELRYGKSLK